MIDFILSFCEDNNKVQESNSMTDTPTQGEKKTLTLNKKPEIKKVGEADQVRQSFSHGRTKTVAVEVKKKRAPGTHDGRQERIARDSQAKGNSGRLTDGEMESRMRAVQEAMKARAAEEERKRLEKIEQEKQRLIEEEQRKIAEAEAELRAIEAAKAEKLLKEKESVLASTKPDDLFDDDEPDQTTIDFATLATMTQPNRSASEKPNIRSAHTSANPARALDDDDDAGRKKHIVRPETKRAVAPVVKKEEAPRKLNRTSITRALSGEGDERSRSLASIRRAKQKHKNSHQQLEQVKIIRDVIIPEVITVSELANRMAVRGGEVVKTLMKLGMMVTINQAIDADTAELVCSEFGHKFKRVSESDIEIGLRGEEDLAENLVSRAPVVTVMGHVDHGKTSLLDALRKTDIVSGEAGGITQHIGAYQVQMASGKKITFIDTPGHAAFTEMRARGANVTDIVVLVVAADDGIMEQTIEAINHAKAAGVPMIVAINKIDKPEANADRVRSELLQHGVVLEEFGGDVMSVEVSAKKQQGLDKLEETILLQSEILDLKANASRIAEGVVIEAQVDRGRGTVATVLIQRGTLKVGNIFVAGSEWGRVRALFSDHGQKITEATPSVPVVVVGFNGVPSAGDEFFVVETEARAREVAEFRQRRERETRAAASARGTMEQIMNRIAAGEAKELGVVIKSDVQGSLEAIMTSIAKLGTDEVIVRVLHGAVGGINESDVTLARASNGIVFGFNVRANPQARDLARRDAVDIRYYSIIYDVIDDVKGLMGGLLAPTLREHYLGMAEIRDVFNITKVGKIAGCYVTEGTVKRGSKVRLLRDNVVIHEGELKTLKRFKDEVKEVKESYECGMAFENYTDIRQGDIIECFEIESIARQLS